MKVVCISGHAQSGKDTYAMMMRDYLKFKGNKVLVTHYADLLKFICKNYFDWNGEKDEAGRELLQYVGTDIIRRQNPTLWVDFVSSMLQYFHTNWEYVIIPDCRFPNEITTLIDNGFDVFHVRIERENFENSLTPEQRQHPSETALDNFTPNTIVYNRGTLEDLKMLAHYNVDNILTKQSGFQNDIDDYNRMINNIG